MELAVLEQELKVAENTLATLEEKQQRKRESENNDFDFDGETPEPSILERLHALQTTADSLALAQDYIGFLESAPQILGENSGSHYDTLFAHAQLCDELAQKVILKHAGELLDTCSSFYEEAYLPLFHYVYEFLVTLLREALQSARYPSQKGCRQLLERKHGSDHLATICRHLTRLETTHEKVKRAVERAADGAPTDSTVLLELFHPLLDRVYFHFINAGSGEENNEKSKLTVTRIDRLPEWLLNYISNNFLQEYGPYEVILSVMGPLSAAPFCKELVQLIQWVLVEQRNFFDDPIVAGPKSNPQVLFQAIEQFLEFDSNLFELLENSSNANNNSAVDGSAFIAESNSPFSGVMDTLVASNEDLFHWWIQRERESVFSMLFPEEEDENSATNAPKTQLANHISPRAELFCALMRSVQLKGSTLNAPGKYLREVAVPLCSQFVDALHETSVDLRNRLVQKRNRQQAEQHQPSLPGAVDTEKLRLVSNFNEWIEIINGAKLASQILLSKERAVSRQSDHDLGRFGRSLERLVEVMMDEFAIAFVETTLMEHAKFANYLMLASHLLASPEYAEENMMWKDDITSELNDTKILLQYFEETCDAILQGEDPGCEEESVVPFAPLGMRSRIADRLADKLLEVALDTNQVTPDIWLKGATIFARDVQALLGSYHDVPTVDRLLEVTNFMTMDYDSFCGLFAAVGGLMGSDAYIDIDVLNADTTLHEQACSMLKVKSISCPLEYAVSILNRRRS